MLLKINKIQINTTLFDLLDSNGTSKAAVNFVCTGFKSFCLIFFLIVALLNFFKYNLIQQVKILWP